MPMHSKHKGGKMPMKKANMDMDELVGPPPGRRLSTGDDLIGPAKKPRPGLPIPPKPPRRGNPGNLPTRGKTK